MTGDGTTVLVAADDPHRVAELRSWLVTEYRVEATTDGDDALAVSADVDAVLIDRDLRTDAGTVVADEIERRGLTQPMAPLHSADEPTGRRRPDDSLVAPVTKSAALEGVDRLLRRARYDELLAECTALAAKRGALEADAAIVATEDRPETLQRRLDELLAELDELVATFDGEDFRAAFEACRVAGPGRSHRASDLP
ncbi:HalX domain-containing protein [Natrinema salaciae]|nr:HalX domain-containing protein [Natrinema salaciae]